MNELPVQFNILDEDPIRLQQAALIAKVSFVSAWRWVLVGVAGPNGERVKLEACRCGRRWLTSKAALGRFAAKLDSRKAPPVNLPRSPGKRKKAIRDAEATLQRAGI
jgi:hypothetical protein